MLLNAVILFLFCPKSLYFQTSPEQVEDTMKKHRMFESTLDANDEKIKFVLEMGQKLINENHYLSGKIRDKVDTIKHRF